MDEDGLTTAIKYPDGATTRDKQKILQRATKGFARTNVRTVADMNALSIVTYSDYLDLAASELDDSAYALIWLSAFAGLDVSRRLVMKKTPRSMPRNDQILVNASDRLLEYNVLRRTNRHDSTQYDTAGRMRLPLPERVTKGLCQIIEVDEQDLWASRANQWAKKFSKSQSGLTPTLNRLRASARVHLAPLGFTELEFCAIAGRVNPALKGISAYYPYRARDLTQKFVQTYHSLLKSLQLSSCDRIETPRSLQKDFLFCKPSVGIRPVEELLEILGAAYSKECVKIEDKELLVTPSDVTLAVNIHETACYVLQQLATGLRPIGEVGDCVILSDTLGAMIRDKNSRTTAERSFSPVCRPHSDLLHCNSTNRGILKELLRRSGRPLVHGEPESSLACQFRTTSSSAPVQALRLKNHYFHKESPAAPYVSDLRHTSNWLRHVATEYVGCHVPQWMADEFFGHMRIGRQPMGRWSTAGASHFTKLQNCIEELIDRVIDDRLLTTIPVTGLHYATDT